MEALLLNHYFMAFYGWFAYNFLMLSIEKDKYDLEEKDMPYLAYTKKTWDNWVINLIFTLPFAAYGPDFVPLTETGLELSDGMYFLSPIAVQKLIQIIKNANK